MNLTELLLQKISKLFETNKTNIVYVKGKGLKVLRYGSTSDRFDQKDNVHYNKPPVTRGTWATIFPYSPFNDLVTQHDKKRHPDLRDQSPEAHRKYSNVEGDPFNKPITFYWNRDIYSHIDRGGSYNNKGWIYYKNVSELVDVINNYSDRIVGSVNQTYARSQNSNYPGSDIRYFANHEWEVYIPHD